MQLTSKLFAILAIFTALATAAPGPVPGPDPLRIDARTGCDCDGCRCAPI